jgi:hypothetical protein
MLSLMARVKCTVPGDAVDDGGGGFVASDCSVTAGTAHCQSGSRTAGLVHGERVWPALGDEMVQQPALLKRDTSRIAQMKTTRSSPGGHSFFVG